MGSSYGDFLKLTITVARRGLSQGAVTSPLLARVIIRRALEEALPDPQIARFVFLDDLNIGAPSKAQAVEAKQRTTTYLSSLPAGPLELHDEPIVNAQTGQLIILGYKLEPGHGHGENHIHVKPSRKRTDRFKLRLRQKLIDAEPGEDPFEIAEAYRQRWFASQQAWTKVPIHSDRVSSDITLSYVSDFLEGVPMGTFKLNKPKLASVGDEKGVVD